MDALVAKTNFEKLDHPIEKIIVSGFDGVNPPPRLKDPERLLFYRFGITTYFQTTDTLMFLKIQKLEAIHLNEEGEIIHTFTVEGSRYSESFKGYFTHLSLEEEKRIYFRGIYLKDKKSNFIN